MHYRTIRNIAARGTAAAALAAALATPAFAQSGEDLMALGDRELNDALEMRYDASLAATQDPAIVNAIDARYHWASEAKVQCAIAVGFMKNDLRDADSIRKCDAAYGRWMTPPAPPAPPPPPPPPPVPQRPKICDQAVNTVFFDFDSDIAPSSTATTAQFLHSNTQICEWTGFDIVGHTDRSGPDAYNEALSIRRAQAVADIMIAQGIAPDMITTSGVGENDLAVQTVDGERNPQNRRVVITVR